MEKIEHYEGTTMSYSSSKWKPLFICQVLLILVTVATFVLSILVYVNMHGSGCGSPEASFAPAVPLPEKLVLGKGGPWTLSLDLEHKKLTFSKQETSQTSQSSISINIGENVGHKINSLEAHDDHIELEFTSTGSRLKIRRDDTLSDSDLTVYDVSWTTNQLFQMSDSVNFGKAHWYGGCELHTLKWPWEQNDAKLAPYLTADIYHSTYGGVMERYWLSSEHLAITVDNTVPLWLSSNELGSGRMVFHAQFSKSAYENFVDDVTTAHPHLRYKIWLGKSVKDLHLKIMKKEFAIPTGIPDQRMLIHPVWSTWARYHVFVNQKVVLEFADNIMKNNFNHSHIEIDDNWATHYGDFKFDAVKFPDVKDMVQQLKNKGFRTTVWVHPFTNFDADTFKEISGTDNMKQCEKKLFVCQKRRGKVAAVNWWQGFGATVDPTSRDGEKWFLDNLKKFKEETGIDSYKFDAGEVEWMPDGFTLANGNYPYEYTQKYVEMCAKLGGMVEVRSAHTNQREPIFVRVMDKDSKWEFENGLKAMLTSTLTLSVLGYPFILPDMVGGNAYGKNQSDFVYPDETLYVRWLAANVFLPSIQLSIEPWHYSNQTLEASRKLIKIREDNQAKIIDAAEEVKRSGAPMIRPLWWIEESETAFSCYDEYLLGDDILVAPIVSNSSSRQIYIPVGKWKNQIDQSEHEGPKHIEQIVNIDQLAWFTKI